MLGEITEWLLAFWILATILEKIDNKRKASKEYQYCLERYSGDVEID